MKGNMESSVPGAGAALYCAPVSIRSRETSRVSGILDQNEPLRIKLTWRDLREVSGRFHSDEEVANHFRALVAAGDLETELLPDGSGVYAVLPDCQEAIVAPRAPNPRKGINKLRFEILKRDKFTCVYCGAKAPSVQLVVDHVIPVVAGGLTVPDNLAAACLSCNQGKGGRCL